jgi:hypothetical protein
MTSTALPVGDDSDAVGPRSRRPADADSVPTGHDGVAAPPTLDVDTTRRADDAAVVTTPRPTDIQTPVEARLDG